MRPAPAPRQFHEPNTSDFAKVGLGGDEVSEALVHDQRFPDRPLDELVPRGDAQAPGAACR